VWHGVNGGISSPRCSGSSLEPFFHRKNGANPR
jgi:hypothetical protein